MSLYTALPFYKKQNLSILILTFQHHRAIEFIRREVYNENFRHILLWRKEWKMQCLHSRRILEWKKYGWLKKLKSSKQKTGMQYTGRQNKQKPN